MTYRFPDELGVLRTWLAGHGADVDGLATERQAAFRAQQMIGTRFRLPVAGQPCTDLLRKIQRHIIDRSDARHRLPSRPAKRGAPARRSSARSSKVNCDGLVVFTDGACVPNPGPGGWAWVAYRDGVEIAHKHGGEIRTTNNRMELEAIARALSWLFYSPEGARSGSRSIRLYTDSDYAKSVSTGANKAKKNRDVVDFIQEQLKHLPADLEICWIRGHDGDLGNERADELAELGRLGAVSGVAA